MIAQTIASTMQRCGLCHFQTSTDLIQIANCMFQIANELFQIATYLFQVATSFQIATYRFMFYLPLSNC